jgi:flagellar basal body-associated protein FliL
MTQKTLSSLIFTIAFSLSSFAVLAKNHSTKIETEQTSKEVKTNTATEHADHAKNTPASTTDSHSKVPHGKSSVPHFEELPHIHKYHKERVKKIKKHHSKLWILSQVLVVLCNISILIIGFLHATH